MTTGIVLAGGRSSRLGIDKASLLVAGETLLKRVVVALTQITQDIVVVKATNQPLPTLPKKVRIVEDLLPDRGPLGGLYTGLEYSTSTHAFVVGCDMPLLNPSLLQDLLSKAEDYDAVIPRIDGRLQTLHAIYRRSCLSVLELLLMQENSSLYDLVMVLNTFYVEKSGIKDMESWFLSRFSVNTHSDVEYAEQVLAHSDLPT